MPQNDGQQIGDGPSSVPDQVGAYSRAPEYEVSSRQVVWVHQEDHEAGMHPSSWCLGLYETPTGEIRLSAHQWYSGSDSYMELRELVNGSDVLEGTFEEFVSVATALLEAAGQAPDGLQSIDIEDIDKELEVPR